MLTKAEYAYEEMRARILDGRLAAGSLLISENIAQELALSTTPVREAMRRLASDDLITLTAHRDARVRGLTRAEIAGLYAVRRVLDPLAASEACQEATEEELRVPQQLLKALASSKGEHLLELNRQFHRAMYTCCRNEVLIRLLDSLWDRSDRYRRALPLRSRSARATRQDDHAAMADAFSRGDSDALRPLIERHLDRSLTSMLEQLPE